MTPSIVALAVLGVYPLVFIVAASLTESTLGKPFQAWIGWANFGEVLSDPDSVASLWRTAIYAVVVAVASTLAGLALALALEGVGRRRPIVTAVLLLPLIAPPVIVGTLWKLVLNPSGGLLSTVLGWFGVSGFSPLSSTTWALPAIAVADVWEWTPLIALLIYAALLGRDPSVTEAARLDGAGGLTLLRHVTLPAVLGTVIGAFLIRLVLAFKVFDLVFMMTSGGPGQATTTTSYLIYQAALKEFDVGRASALTLLLAVIVTLVTIPVAAFTRKAHLTHG